MKKNRIERKPYKCFYPIKRVKGSVKKVHRLGMTNYQRYLYINPTEGMLISYQS
jgi:hypothetical protein